MESSKGLMSSAKDLVRELEEIGPWVRFVGLHQRIYWRNTDGPGFDPPSPRMVRWIADNITHTREQFRFRLAVLHLSHVYEPALWPDHPPYTTLLQQLNTPRLVNEPLVAPFWREPSIEKVIFENILMNVLDAGGERFVQTIEGHQAAVYEIRSGQQIKLGEIPIEQHEGMITWLTMWSRFANPIHLPAVVTMMHQRGCRPEVNISDNGSITCRFIGDHQWLSRFELTPEKIRALMKV